VLLTLVIAALIRTFLVQPFFIPSGSMEQTLRRGDRVLVDKVSYRFGEIRRGDVVVFNGVDSFTPEAPQEPAGNLLQRGLRAAAAAVGVAPPGEQDFIKRVIGVSGDRVRCCDSKSRITVNGVPVDERSYLYPEEAASESTFDVRVPEGRLWVMGDHRSRSADSRSHQGDPGGGTVPEDKVIGRAFSIVWPPSRLTGIGRPHVFDEVQREPVALERLVPAARAAPAMSYAVGLGVAFPFVIRRRRRAHGGGRGR
jgi:signal peptidase I